MKAGGNNGHAGGLKTSVYSTMDDGEDDDDDLYNEDDEEDEDVEGRPASLSIWPGDSARIYYSFNGLRMLNE